MSRTLLVCGSRTYSSQISVWSTLDAIMSRTPFQYLITGEYRGGADMWAKAWCAENEPLYRGFPADWDRYGKRAGYLRNAQMLSEGKPDLVVAFFDSSPCRGTHMMCKLAEAANVEVMRIIL